MNTSRNTMSKTDDVDKANRSKSRGFAVIVRSHLNINPPTEGTYNVQS